MLLGYGMYTEWGTLRGLAWFLACHFKKKSIERSLLLVCSALKRKKERICSYQTCRYIVAPNSTILHILFYTLVKNSSSHFNCAIYCVS